MNTQIAHKTLAAALIAGLVGFSSLGFAQSEAIEALNQQDSQPQTDAQVQTHPMADQLAADLNSFNRQNKEGRIVGQSAPVQSEPAQVSQTAVQLADAIDNYNAQASQSLVLDTHMPADAAPQSYPQSQALAADLTRYNEAGGNLNALRF